MSSQSVLSRIPILRVLVPFITGILIHGLWHCWWAPLLLLVLAATLYLILIQQSRTPYGRLRWNHYFIAPLSLAALALGWLCAVIHCPPRLTDGQCRGRVLCGRIENLDYTDFSTRMVIQVLDEELPWCRVMVSTRGCDYSLRTGDLMAWQPALAEVSDMGNPDEMEYAGYLLHTYGIRYQQHLNLNQIRKIGHSPTMRTRMAEVRRDMQYRVFNSNLTPESQRFVVALLLGNSSFIDQATRQEFSSAGVAHVLALSGLHVGIIALIIWWLLFPLDYIRLKKLRLVVTLAAIVLFALFTGLSPSVVRSSVMIGFTFASFVFFRRSVSLNALAASALIILVFSPSALFHVGFQLSFITVLAILVFARLPQGLECRYRWVNNLTSTVITSLVAMLATAALSAHYFHTVSFLSVLSNLIILPVLPVFMALGALFLLVTAAGLECSILDWAINGIYQFLDCATRFVNTIPLSHIRGIYVSTFGVVAYFVVILLFLMWLYHHNYRYLLGAGGALIVLFLHSLWIDARTTNRGLIIFNSFSNTPIMYYDNGKGYVWIPDDEDTDSASFSRYYAGFIARHNIGELHFFTDSDTLRMDGVLISPPHAYLMGRRILAVGSGKWKHATTSHRLSLNDIIVTKRYHGSADKLQELYQFDRIILSGAMHNKEAMLHECDSLHMMVHDLASQGALLLP